MLKKYGMTRKLKCRRQEKNDEKAGCLLTKKPEFDIEKLFITERNARNEKKKNNIFVFDWKSSINIIHDGEH